MQVSLFRAFKSINIEDEIAERAVKVIEEHIAMSVAQAVRPLENKIDTLIAKIDVLGTKIETVSTGTQTKIDALASKVDALASKVDTTRWVAIGTTALIGLGGTAVGIGKLFF